MALDKRYLLNVARLTSAAAFAFGGSRLRQPAALAFVAMYLFPTLRRNCAWHGPVLTRFETDEPAVWLTIDDGPDRRCTPLYLDMLEEYNARASFFVIGSRCTACPRICREILAHGHKVENHTFSHPSGLWWALPPWSVQREISGAQAAISAACGVVPRLFRCPAGMCGPWVHRSAAEENLRVVGWSADGFDGCPRIPSDAAADLLASAGPGAILLLHAGARVRHRLLTLRQVLDGLRERGLRCVIPAEEDLR
jgi:peptidoglycan-N-acetylglucosamine deacetylase